MSDISADLAPGEMRTIEHNGETFSVVNVDGRLYAFSDTCTHLGCGLHEGKVVAHKQVQCPCHGARFDMTTGAALAGPTKLPSLKTASVNLQDGRLVLS